MLVACVFQVPQVPAQPQWTPAVMPCQPQVLGLVPTAWQPIPAAAGFPLGPQPPTGAAEPAGASGSPARSASDVAGRVWELAREAEGCRLLQEILEGAGSDAMREALAMELRGHVWQAMRHRHANHVVQKCILTMRPAAVQFIIDEFEEKGAENIVKAARHAYGCRILQRMLEHCRPDQLEFLLTGIFAEAVPLSKHVYGNFVVQHLFEYGTDGRRRQLAAEFTARAAELGSDVHSGAVLAKALAFCQSSDQVALAAAIVRDGVCLKALAKSRHGSPAARLVLQTLRGAELEEAQRQLEEEIPALSCRRYGRAVVACLDSLAN